MAKCKIAILPVKPWRLLSALLGFLSTASGFSVSKRSSLSTRSHVFKKLHTNCRALGATTAYQTSSGDGQTTRPYLFVILGGPGKIGTAIACHLLLRATVESEIILVGRRQVAGEAAVKQVWKEFDESQSKTRTLAFVGKKQNENRLKFALVEDVWNKDDPALRKLVETCDCLIHAAGPFLDRKPTPLFLAMEYQCPAYVDISDPIPFLETSLLQDEQAKASGTTALLAAGAFPGMSNVLAMEAASALESSRIRDVRFHYFTAGLGGSGPLNLFITNLGFGEPMVQFAQGQLRFYTALSGLLLGTVDFFLPEEFDGCGFGNKETRTRVGTSQVFAWPFPEAATVPTQLGARGDSWACMGTAPEIWNYMLGILVNVIPRPWWRNQRFSKFMADFSQPLVRLSDQYLKWNDVNKVGETHAMRIDVTGGWDGSLGVSIVQAHDSFRQCVGQSCAEFALDCLEHPKAGVSMTEQRYSDARDRARIITNLVSTPGTFCYTGPVQANSIQAPSNIENAILYAEVKEAKP